MRLIPGKTKVRIELFKGVSLVDISIGGVAIGLILLVFTSNFIGKLYVCLAIAFVAGLLLIRFDTEPCYIYLVRILKFVGFAKNFGKNAALADKDGEAVQATPKSFVDKVKKFLADNKAEKEIYKQENKILSNKKSTKEEIDAVWLARANRSAAKKKARKTEKSDNAKYDAIENIIAFTGIKDDFIEYGNYYGVALEIPPVEFRFFSHLRRENSIEGAVGRMLRTINTEYSANIVKIDRPMLYDRYIGLEDEKIIAIRKSFESGMLSEEELKARIDLILERKAELEKLCFEDQVVQPFYYIVLFDSDKKQLTNTVNAAIDTLKNGELFPKRLNNRELAVFLKYTNEIDFDEREAENVPEEELAKWALPSSICFKPKYVEINNIITHNLKVINYPMTVDDAWMASLMSIPSTKIMIKIKPLDHAKSVTTIDHSLQEINDRLNSTGVESKRIELTAHAESLSELLVTLQGDNEILMNVSIYVSAYDINLTRNTAMPVQPPKSLRSSITSMKKAIRRVFSEEKLKVESMEFSQVQAFIASQVSGYDPMEKEGRGMPSNSIAAAYPWVFSNVCDKNGVKLGYNNEIPVFLDFFRRDSERVNSNMVIVGKSGSGKSYATKSILSNLAADNTKIFILDPENEYAELAHNLHGKMINVGNASKGRLNPFHIITALDDETVDDGAQSNSYTTHLQFLEEFFKQSLVDCDKSALEYLNSLIDRTYLNKGITAETNLALLKPEDYPIFDDLYDTILTEFQVTQNSYIKTMLRTLMNYISKFSTGGRNSTIWNGPSTITTDENFTVFNFQSLLANRNTIIANSQMLLVLKYIDNEIIKNRDYNIKYHTNRKIAVIIDEAHVFIDTKYPIALDFMFQLAKRIRKYNGMQIVITQNIKDFVGSEEIARKSTAIINACQYSFIFSLSPNDMEDLCRLYEKSGGINEVEQEQIVSAQRGQAFTILSAQHRSTFKVQVPSQFISMFKDADYTSKIFVGEEGAERWESIIGNARELREELLRQKDNGESVAQGNNGEGRKNDETVTFAEITGAQYERDEAARVVAQARAEAEKELKAEVRKEVKEGFIAEAKKGAKQKVLDSADISSDDLDNDEGDNKASLMLGNVHFEIVKDEPAVSFEQIEANEDDNTEEYIDNRQLAIDQMAKAGTENAVIQPQIVMQAPNNDKLDEAISKLADAVENIGKMSYESIMNEVRNMVGGKTAQPDSYEDDSDTDIDTEEKYDAFGMPTSTSYSFESENDSDSGSKLDDLFSSYERATDSESSSDLFGFNKTGASDDTDENEESYSSDLEEAGADTEKSVDDLIRELLGETDDSSDYSSTSYSYSESDTSGSIYGSSGSSDTSVDYTSSFADSIYSDDDKGGSGLFSTTDTSAGGASTDAVAVNSKRANFVAEWLEGDEPFTTITLDELMDYNLKRV